MQTSAYRFEFHGCIRLVRIQIAPDRLGPAGIRCAAADDVQVQLRDKVAERGKIDFCAVKILFDETRDHGAFSHDLIAWPGRQIQQAGAGHFRHKYEPRDQRVLVQQHMAVLQPAQEAGVGKQLLVYYKLRQGGLTSVTRLKIAALA